MAYDAARQRIVLTGGDIYASNGGDWEWDGGTWTQRTGGPGPREFHSMVYDTTTQSLLMFGGTDGQMWQRTAEADCGTADFNQDGDSGTDADIEAFFACLAGSCCPACEPLDFNKDGDTATDADIESFFRVLSGNPC
jgi:hypothetical protein